jgi:hypothetical protein
LVDSAKGATLKARRQSQTRPQSILTPVVGAKIGKQPIEPDSDLPAEPFPFEIWNE